MQRRISSQRKNGGRDESFAFENMPHSEGHSSRSRNLSFSARSSNSGHQVVSAEALSLAFMKSLSSIGCCKDCDKSMSFLEEPTSKEGKHTRRPLRRSPELESLQALMERPSHNQSISPFVEAPMLPGSSSSSSLRNFRPNDAGTVEKLIGEYIILCQAFNVPYNAGVMTTLRFSLPSLKVTGSFHDLDMLPLIELLLKYANTRLAFLRRLDFTIASKEGKQFKSVKLGFSSHGALALAKALQTTLYISEVWMPRHRIGAYGASAIFLACRDNPTIHVLNLRRCRLGERGAFALAEVLMATPMGTALVDVDISANSIGHRGTVAVERALARRNERSSAPPIFVNLEGNLVFPEIMNGITHGLGVMLSMLGGYLLSFRVQDQSLAHSVSCAVYTTSLVTLYMSSTLFHSFFILQSTRYIFQVMDKCAIYVLIAGSYTPFLSILFADKPIFSVYLLGFIWTCGFLGISVEALAPTWRWRFVFSLSMYVGMGWACVVCLPEIKQRLNQESINLMVLGGVGYTAGIPFFVRNNNLDHVIWHLFVLAGSIFHWLAVYMYVAPYSLALDVGV